MYLDTVHFSIPTAMVWNSRHGRPLDKFLDDAIATHTDLTTLWHVVGDRGETHLLFVGEEKATAYAEQVHSDELEEFAAWASRSGVPEWYESRHMLVYQHTEKQEADRQAKLRRNFHIAEKQAKAMFANPNLKRAFNVVFWWDFLNPAAMLYGEKHGLVMTKETEG